MRLRNCLGMIWSVSTFARSIVTTRPVCFVKGFIARKCTKGDDWGTDYVSIPLADVDKMPGTRCRGRHCRRDEMRAAAAALAAFEVAV